MSPDTASAASDVTLVIVATCEECARRRHEADLPPETGRQPVLIEMVPGDDGVPWFLCVSHWFDGIHPNDPRRLGRVLDTEVAVVTMVPTPVPVAPVAKPASKTRKKRHANVQDVQDAPAVRTQLTRSGSSD